MVHSLGMSSAALGGYPGVIARVSRDAIQRLSTDTLASLRRAKGTAERLVTKNPNDVFKIEQIREFYARRPGQVRFILTLRDPRAILTSTYENRAGYYWSVEGWWRMFHAFERAHSCNDALVVRFEQLVSAPQTVEGQFTQFIGRQPVGSFDQFHARVPEGFDTRALNGVRPLDTGTIVKWQRAEHRERIRDVLAEMPELPDLLVKLGYEVDTRWMQAYL